MTTVKEYLELSGLLNIVIIIILEKPTAVKSSLSGKQ